MYFRQAHSQFEFNTTFNSILNFLSLESDHIMDVESKTKNDLPFFFFTVNRYKLDHPTKMITTEKKIQIREHVVAISAIDLNLLI